MGILEIIVLVLTVAGTGSAVAELASTPADLPQDPPQAAQLAPCEDEAVRCVLESTGFVYVPYEAVHRDPGTIVEAGRGNPLGNPVGIDRRYGWRAWGHTPPAPLVER